MVIRLPGRIAWVGPVERPRHAGQTSVATPALVVEQVAP